MSSSSYLSSSVVAPCVVDQGTIYQKQDIRCLLGDLRCVRYIHEQDGQVLREGEGYLKEVFADSQRATVVANRTLYINVCSFDYLELTVLPDGESSFDLVQDGRRLRLIPTSSPMQLATTAALDTATLEVMMAEVLSANLDAQLDDDEHPTP